MKNRIKYLTVVLLLLTSVSCNDWLELEPPNGLIREEFWQSKEDVEAVLMATYQKLAALNEDLFVFGEIRADMLEGDLNQPRSEELIQENNIYPDNNIVNWLKFYEVINFANEVIKNAPLVQEVDNTFNDFLKDGYVAEAVFLRSLTYFYLVRLYKDVPLVLEPAESDEADFYKSKTPEEEILNQIVADLNDHINAAPSGGFETIRENKGRASRGAFNALLADIELWRFNYEQVLEYTNRVINAGDESTEQYALMPSAKWFELFYPGNTLESIFEIQFDDALDQPSNLWGKTYRTSNQYIPSQKALEMFAVEYAGGELIRGEDATIKKYGSDDYIVWKYVGRLPDGQSTRSGAEQRSANWIVYRLADVLLMRAEALSQLGRFQAAFDILEMIKVRAGVPLPALANNPVAYEDAILNERAAEFAYEGKRWFDLLRMGRRNNFARKNELIEIIINNVPSTQKRILAAKLNNPLGWYLPVYEGELERNQNLEQNPYYDF